MTSLRTITYGSWQDFTRDLFLELYPAGAFSRGRYLFRGEGQASWRLVSLFDRQFASVPLEPRLELWDRLTAEWRQECLDAGVAAPVVADDAALWALGQHHGLPTRLLDWSLSPYVAAFFAFRNHLLSAPTTNDQVAVWVLHTESSIWAGPGVEVIAPPSPDNARLRNQGGRFTLLRAATTYLEEYVGRMTARTVADALPAARHQRTHRPGRAGRHGHHRPRPVPDLGGLANRATMRAVLSVLDP